MYEELKKWAGTLGMEVTEEEFSWGEESGVEQITWKYQSSRLGSNPQYLSCEKHADMPFYDFYSWLFIPERVHDYVVENLLEFVTLAERSKVCFRPRKLKEGRAVVRLSIRVFEPGLNEQVFEYIKARFDTFKRLLLERLAKV
ncbi:MAG TPA: hypothetical protein ACFYD3_02935 [Candidatus Hypogeohydataceae bacterium YC41]